MHIVRGPFVDPAADEFALRFCQWLTVIGWRHHNVRIVGFDPQNHLALVRAAGNDGNLRFASGNSVVAKIQSQFRLATVLILSVAKDAFLGKDRLDLAGKVDRGLSADLSAERDHRGDGDMQEAGHNSYFTWKGGSVGSSELANPL